MVTDDAEVDPGIGRSEVAEDDLTGVDADADAQPDLARGDYENALRVDPSNPYAYLALARSHVAGPTPMRAFDFADKAESLLRAEGAWNPRVEAHVVGLRGAAYAASGRREQAEPLLARARSLDPWAWNDGNLAASELR